MGFWALMLMACANSNLQHVRTRRRTRLNWARNAVIRVAVLVDRTALCASVLSLRTSHWRPYRAILILITETAVIAA